jgi:N-acetylglutamate synthase
MPVDLLPMTDCDLEPLLQFWSRTEGVWLNESDTPEHLREFLGRNPGLSLVARDGHQITGAVLCGHDGRRGYLHHLAVAPGHRKQGLGRRLVEQCLAALSERGILKCNIFLYADNEPGALFWARCGWARRSDLVMMQHVCRKTHAEG